jgi:hypothetical protein
MAVILVPRPKSKRDPDRPASSLLLAQVQHLRQAEKILPPRYHSEIFIKAIHTEGEAANYVKAVTEAIHAAHADAAAARVRKAPKRKRVLEIAAVADEAAERKSPARAQKSKKKKSASKTKRKS